MNRRECIKQQQIWQKQYLFIAQITITISIKKIVLPDLILEKPLLLIDETAGVTKSLKLEM